MISQFEKKKDFFITRERHSQLTKGERRSDTLTDFQEEQTAYRPPFPKRTSLPTAAPSWRHAHTPTQKYVHTDRAWGRGAPRCRETARDSDGEERRWRMRDKATEGGGGTAAGKTKEEERNDACHACVCVCVRVLRALHCFDCKSST